MATTITNANSFDKYAESFNKKFAVTNNKSSHSSFKQKKDIPTKNSLDITNDLQFPSLNIVSHSKNTEEITLKNTYNSIVSAPLHNDCEEPKEELPKGWVTITFNKTNRNIEFYPILDNKDKGPVTDEDDYDPNLIMMKMSKIVSENREKHKYMYDQIHGNGAFNELHYISRNYLSDEEF